MNGHLFDAHLKTLIADENMEVPASVQERTAQILASLPTRIPKKRLQMIPTITSIAACMAFFLLGVLPNISTAYATAVDDIPVIGAFVRVLTIRNYLYEDTRHELNAKIPEIMDNEHMDATTWINEDIEALTSAIISKFYQELKIPSNKGYGSVYIDYETITNSIQWFTLKLSVSEVTGSSDMSFKYYHIDRTAGRYVTFGDLFPSKNYAWLEKRIVSQIQTQSEHEEDIFYWGDIEEDSIALDAEQNFYFRENGDLVIVYDKYEIGPGAMGCPEFVIPCAEYRDYIAPHYAEIFVQN